MNTASGVKLIRSNNADEDVEWITVKGAHIPIKKGQSKEKAIKEFFENKGKKSKKDDGMDVHKYADKLRKESGDEISHRDLAKELKKSRMEQGRS